MKHEMTVSQSAKPWALRSHDRGRPLRKTGWLLASKAVRVGPNLGYAAEHAGVIGRGLAAASSILQDGPAVDRHNGPIAEGRHCGGQDRAEDLAPARPVPVLDAHRIDGPNVVGGHDRDPQKAGACRRGRRRQSRPMMRGVGPLDHGVWRGRRAW
jgi:hypothetical protein